MFMMCVGEHARFAGSLLRIVRTQEGAIDVFSGVRVLLQPFDVIAMLSHCERAL